MRKISAWFAKIRKWWAEKLPEDEWYYNPDLGSEVKVYRWVKKGEYYYVPFLGYSIKHKDETPKAISYAEHCAHLRSIQGDF